MSWLGKFVGGALGFAMGGPVGAALGAALGHQFDQNGVQFKLGTNGYGTQDIERLQMSFLTTTFQVMGHIAKADGRVCEAEIAVAREIMDRMMLPDDVQKMAMQLFRDGRHDSFPFDRVVDQFQEDCRGRAHLTRMLVALQTEAALADGPLKPAEESLLLRLCDRLQFSRYEFYGIRTRLEAERRFSGFSANGSRRENHQQQRYQQRQWQRYEPPRPRETPLSEAYVTLGLAPAATDSEIKGAYRRLISKHHPDKLSARGLSNERMQKATEQTQKIQKAYDAICKARQI